MTASRVSVDPVPHIPVELDADTLSGLMLGGTVLAVGLAAVGAVCGASLLLYSPTKLARDDRGRELVAYLEVVERELQVVARLLTLGGAVSAMFLTWFGAGDGRWFAIVAVALVLLLTSGVLPAQFAEARPEATLRLSLRVVRPLRLPLRWVIVLPLLSVSRAVLRLFRISTDSRRSEPEEIADDILAAVSDSAQEVELPDEERRWIENIVELKNMCASEVMTPRTDMVSFPASLPLVEAVRRAIDAGFSRYPVYDARIDDVIGVFYAKDALEAVGSEKGLDGQTVGEMVRKPIFVPESMSLVDLLRQFRATKKQLAVVLDEYGGTAGLVSIEDVLEEIVGDIEDEYDPEGQQPIKVVEDGRVIEVSGRTRIDEANEHLAERVPEGEDYDSVAGWVFSTLDRIPTTGETLRMDGIEIRILEADDRRIARMRLTVVPPATADGAAPLDGAPEPDPTGSASARPD